MFLLGRKKFDYVISEPPISTDSKYANWRAEDAQIRSCLWNSMDFKISCSLVFLPTAKLVWEQAKELYSGVSNLKRICDLHQNDFTLSLLICPWKTTITSLRVYVKNSIFISPSPFMLKP